ncbi:MAG: NAD-binding protein [Candidatus Eremiobacteraeota bacterium]|nr:NAD-binding protein [Candidatus Eremiobacteraeota bacterium]
MIIDKEASFTLEDHLVILAWDERLVKVLSHIESRQKLCGLPAINLVISAGANSIPWEKLPGEKVYRLIGDPTDEGLLRAADIEKARNVILLANEKERSVADARSILIILAIKSISKNIHVCVEVVDTDNIASMKLARADHIISIPNLREKLLAQAAVTHYVSHVYKELFDLSTSQSLFAIAVNGDLVGKTVSEASALLYKKEMLLIALSDRKTEKPRINPPRSYCLAREDQILVLANQHTFDFARLCTLM